MLFYKYQKPDTLAFSMLRNGEIFFAGPGELNDASECRPRYVFNGSEDLWRRLTNYILSGACFTSDYFQPDRSDALKTTLSLSDSIGTCLKREARSRDLGLEELGRLFRSVLEQKLPRQDEGINRDFLFQLILTFIEKRLPQDLSEDKYIACFSRNATNATMWGHYADAERGFVIVYESTDGCLHVRSPINVLHGHRPAKDFEGVAEVGIYKNECLELAEVYYRKRPPKVNAFHRLIPKFYYSEMEDHYDVPALIGDEAQEKKESLIGLVKYSDWRYEKEIRAFFPAYGTILPDARVLQVEPCNLRGVILGPRMSCENKARIVLCCHLFFESLGQSSEARREFQIFQAPQTVDRFNFDILPVGTLGEHYFPPHLPLRPMRRLDEEAVKRIQAMAISIAASGRTSRSTDETDALPSSPPSSHSYELPSTS